jgi:hypothetical protein
MLSAIQVQNHHFVDFSLKPEGILTEAEMAQRSITCRHQLTWTPRDAEQQFWLARLRVEIIHPEGGGKSLYTGVLEIVGEFALHPEVPMADRQKLVSMNSGAILYGAIREWFAIFTARSLHGMVELPTVDARCFMPKSPVPPAPLVAPVRQ